MRASVVGLLLVVSLATVGQAASLVLNEVEINPEGLDSSAEWVEILNVSEEPIDLAG